MERKDRLRRTKLKIKERLRKLKSLFNKEPKFDGMLRNNNEMNHLSNYGKPRKTNNRKRKSNYRCHTCGFGKADNYSPHDQRQIDSLFYNEE